MELKSLTNDDLVNGNFVSRIRDWGLGIRKLRHKKGLQIIFFKMSLKTFKLYLKFDI
jgi:hypothetical protein